MKPTLDPKIQPEQDASSVVAALRRGVRDGRHPAGTRMTEEAVAHLLGVSRTPVRLAFRTLEQEGLLQRAGVRGYVVREFSEADVLCAVEVRGVLEGLAARRLGEAGLPVELQAQLQACLSEGERVLATGRLDTAGLHAWSRMNEAFHRHIVEGTGSQVIADAIARNNHLPFASADSITIDETALPQEHAKLRFAQMQHRLVVDALAQGEGARAEMLMREHAWIGVRYGSLFGLAPRAAAG